MTIEAIVEIPKGSLYKYEVDKQDGSLTLDRLISFRYPHNYGFIPNTLCGDGDPLDVFIISPDPIHPLTKVNIKPIGILKCKDNNEEDDKLLAIIDDWKYTNSDIIEIKYFLNLYKEGFEILSEENIEEALKTIERSKIK